MPASAALLALAALALLALPPAAEAEIRGPVTWNPILHVGPEEVDCTGAHPQKCYIARYGGEDTWGLFYDGIGGFEFEAGYRYVLQLLETQLDDPPQDVSSVRSELVEVLARLPDGAVPPPAAQGAAEPSHVICAGTRILVERASTGQPACVMEGSVQSLRDRGWISLIL